MDELVERAVQWGLSKSDGHPRVLADEVRRLREENEGLQRNLSMARELDEDAVTYIFRWRKVAESILHTHRSGDVVLLQEDADALANLLGEAP